MWVYDDVILEDKDAENRSCHRKIVWLAFGD